MKSITGMTCRNGHFVDDTPATEERDNYIGQSTMEDIVVDNFLAPSSFPDQIKAGSWTKWKLVSYGTMLCQNSQIHLPTPSISARLSLFVLLYLLPALCRLAFDLHHLLSPRLLLGLMLWSAVAQGFTGSYCPGQYTETYAPVAKLVSVRILLAWVALWVRQFDCKTAFFYAKICRPLYVRQIPGYPLSNPTEGLCILVALYGLGQSAYEFYRLFL